MLSICLLVPFLKMPNAKIQRRPLRSEAEQRPSGGGPPGPEQTGMTGYDWSGEPSSACFNRKRLTASERSKPSASMFRIAD